MMLPFRLTLQERSIRTAAECDLRFPFVIWPTRNSSDFDMITLVDDDAGVLEANASLLRSLGYDVKTFESSRSLLEWSGLENVCCVITDVMMPGIDGIELQRRLALQGFQFPVIFLTAVTEQGARERLLRAGAYDVLAKPCPEKRLTDCLEMALLHCARRH